MELLFEIFKFTEVEGKQVTEMANEPHSHNYEELLIGLIGSIEHFIDFKTSILHSPLVSFVSKNKVHRIVPVITDSQTKIDVWVIRVKSEFIPETTFQLYANYHNFANLEIEDGKNFKYMATLCQMMFTESIQKIPDYLIIKHLLSSLFVVIETERKEKCKLLGDNKMVQNKTFNSFLKILEDNFRRPESVKFYADKLNMSVRNLNIICQNTMQKSVSEIIEIRKLTEAKNLLINTGKTISEIGFELGYNEKAYFTNAFKKKSGMTPSEFREEMKKLVT